jgi:hypothetical protein
VSNQIIQETVKWDSQDGVHRLCRINTHQNRAWVFGMRWFPLIGAQTKRDILLDQRRKKATHFIASGAAKNRSGSVLGVGMFTVHKSNRQQKLYSAALAFANHKQQDTHILVLQVSNQSWWLVAAHHGTVLCQTDVWYSNRSQVDEHILQIKERFSIVYVEDLISLAGSAGHLGNQSTNDAVEQPAMTTALSWLFRPTLSTQSLSKIQSSSFFKIIFFSVSGIIVVICLFAYLWSTNQALSRHRAQQASALLNDANQDLMLYQHHTYTSLLGMVKHWHALPLDPSGWALKRVECERSNNTFTCQAQYRRDQAHANNGQLSRATPAGWKLLPDTLDQVSLVRQIKFPSQIINWSEFSFQEDWLTPLQQRKAIFQNVQLGAAQALPLSHTHTARPIYRRQIRMSGPLRSLQALSTLNLKIYWQSASLEIVDQSTLDLTHSHFVLHLIGDIFVSS